MFKSILVALALTVGAGLSLAPLASARSVGIGGLGGSGGGSRCSDTTTTNPCWCSCTPGGSELANCQQGIFYDGSFVCAYCYGDSCGTNFTGFGSWSFMP